MVKRYAHSVYGVYKDRNFVKVVIFQKETVVKSKQKLSYCEKSFATVIKEDLFAELGRDINFLTEHANQEEA
uniref:Uncharacterized protein n=1 Tax=Romanomermis culicivorax TaxID=13658 RepID=A0A915IU02_ROMCU